MKTYADYINAHAGDTIEASEPPTPVERLLTAIREDAESAIISDNSHPLKDYPNQSFRGGPLVSINPTA